MSTIRAGTDFVNASTAGISADELAEFAGFDASKMFSDDVRETSRQEPCQIYSPSADCPGGGSDGGWSSENQDRSSSEGCKSNCRSAHQHSMHERFVRTTPQYMRCTDRLNFPSSMEKKSAALNCRYLNPNSKNRIAWQIFDLDRDDAALRFEEANVAVPNIIIENPKNGHAHYAYALEVPVSTSGRARQDPIDYLKAIRLGMTRRLGADPNFVHVLGKNPLHADWRTTFMNTKPHSLHDMACWLEYEDMRPVHKSKAEANDFAQQGRNCELTSSLAKFGLRTGWQMRQAGADAIAFLREMRAQIFELNSALAEPLGFAECQAIAKSVAKWAWAKSSREEFVRIQSYRAQSRARRNQMILSRVPDLASKSNAEIGAILGLKSRAVRNYVAVPRAEYEANSIERQKPWLRMGISRATYYRQRGEV